MDKEKLNIFRGLQRKRKTPWELELEKQSEKMLKEAKLMKAIQDHPGWKLFEDFFEAKYKVLNHELKVCNEKQLPRLQEKAKIIDELYNFMNSKIVRDPDL